MQAGERRGAEGAGVHSRLTRACVAYAAGFAAVTAVAGCRGPGDGNDDPVCPRAAAAFDVHLTAAEGALPEGTRISVTHGGANTEYFTVGERFFRREHAAVCCVPGDGEGVSLSPATCGQPLADASVAPESDWTRVRCLIWSNGAADVMVEANGYPLIEETLAATEDGRYPECGAWDTAVVALVLSKADAGVSDGL